MDQRFWIDERSNCIAIRDRRLRSSSCMSPALTPETEDVVEFFPGHQIDKFDESKPHLSKKIWTVSESTRLQANKICNDLNKDAGSMDTPITNLRNKLTPVTNYFAILKELNKEIDSGIINQSKVKTLNKLLDKEGRLAISLLPEIVNIIRQIPNDAIN